MAWSPSPSRAAPVPTHHGLRILTIVSEAPPIASGIARTIAHLQDGLRARGHEVDVIAHPEVPRLAVGEVRLSGLLFELGRVANRLDDYDVVHVHGAAPTVSDVFLLFSRLRGHRPLLVYTHHCDIEVGPGPLRALYRRVHHWLSGHADEIVSTSLHYATELGDAKNISVVPLGVDWERFADACAKDDQFTVLFVGQFRPYKGVRVLLQALSQVHGCRLLIAGKGPEEDEYRRLATELNLDVEFHVGASDDDIAELYRRAHVVALPSVTRAEAFGLVLLEGMAAGCVPVASDLPGVRSVLGRIGFTVPVASASALATTIRQLRDDPALVAQIAERARERARQYGWDRTVGDYERVFRSLVAARELRRAVKAAPGSRAALDVFAREAARILAADRVQLLVPSAGSLEAIGSSTAAGHAARRRSPAGDLLARYSLNTGESALSADDAAPRGLRGARAGRRAALAVPLAQGGAPFGVLLALRGSPFDRRDLEAAERLARHAAPALHVAASERPPATLPRPARARVDADLAELAS